MRIELRGRLSEQTRFFDPDKLPKDKWAGWMGTSNRTFRKIISAIRELSPDFYPENRKPAGFSLIPERQAIALILAYRYGDRVLPVISLLPPEFPADLFTEIDQEWHSWYEMAKSLKVSPSSLAQLVRSSLPSGLTLKEIPFRRHQPNPESGRRPPVLFNVFPPDFWSIIEEQIEFARENKRPLTKWFRTHRSEIQIEVQEVLPNFKIQFQEWLQKNIPARTAEKIQPPRPIWRPSPQIRQSITVPAGASVPYPASEQSIVSTQRGRAAG